MRATSSLKILSVILIILLVNLTSVKAGIWDAKADWSDTDNPNELLSPPFGIWSYHDSETGFLLLQTSSGAGGSPGGWSQDGTGETVPNLFDDHLGEDDHNPDEFAGHGPWMVRWTSPINGLIEINGTLWQEYETSRQMAYYLRHNEGAPFASGYIPEDGGGDTILKRAGLVSFGPIQMMVSSGDTIDFIADGSGPGGEGTPTFAVATFKIKEPAKGLISCWKLDESSGPIANDSSENHYDADLINSPTWQPTGGQVNGAIELDGVDQYVDAPYILNPADGPFTACVWIKGGQPDEKIICQTDGTGIGRNWLQSPSGYLGTNVKTASGSFLVSTYSGHLDGYWHHVALTWDGARRRLYADGVEVATDPADLGAALESCDGRLFIGAHKSLSADLYWTGRVDDVRLYNQALTEPQIQFLYNNAQVVWNMNDYTDWMGPPYTDIIDDQGGTFIDVSGDGILANNCDNTAWQNTTSAWSTVTVGGEMTPAGSMTMFARHKTSAFAGGIDDLWCLGDKTCSAGGPVYALEFDNGEPRFVVWGAGQGSTSAVSLGQTAQLDTWYDYTGVFDASAGTISIYAYSPVTGQFVAGNSAGVPFAALDTSFGDEVNWCVAPCAANGINDTSNMIELATLWHRALNTTEVAALSENKGASITNGLVSYWPFDSDYLDYSGNHIDGIPVGSPGFTTGLMGNALNLNPGDADKDYVKLGSSSDLNFGSSIDFSVSLWVKTTGWESDAAIISNKNWNLGSNTGWVIAGGNGGSGDWQWNYCGAGSSRRDYDLSGVTISDGSWHHLVVTHDRNGNATFYHDGQQKNTVDISGSIGTIDAGYPTVVGTDGYEGGQWAYWFAGNIDDLAIWERILSPDEISYLWNNGSGNSVIIANVGVDISESNDSTEVEEGGATDSYEIVLEVVPTHDVMITAAPSDAQIDLGNGAGADIILTFTAATWNTAQTVTVTAYDDEVYEGKAAHTTDITHSAASDDSNYDGETYLTIEVSVFDDEQICGDWGYLPTDLNTDCYVDLKDFALFALRWLDTTN